MNDISLLKELGLSEVARRTHIEAEYLGYIVDKNFEKLARFNVKGFIKILERELDIDFTQWMSEYEAFVSERSQNSEHKSISVSPKISAYTADGGHSNAGLKFLVLTLVLVVAGVIYMLSENNYFNGILNIFEDKNKSVTYTGSVTVRQAAKNLDEVKQESKNATNDENLYAIKNIEPVLPPEENISVAAAIPEVNLSVNTDANETMQPSKEENATENEEQNASVEAPKELQKANTDKIWYLTADTKEIKIVPNKKTWLGVIDLQENKKRSIDIKNSFSIEIGKRQLAVTGHGDINLEIDGQTIRFGDDRPKRFLIEKDKVSLLTYDEFVALNKGKSW